MSAPSEPSRRSVLHAFFFLPLAAKKKTKAKKPAKKPTTVVIPTTVASGPALTLAPASASSVPGPGDAATSTSVPLAATTTAYTAADIVGRGGAAVPVPEARAFLVGLAPDRVAALRAVLPAAVGPSLDLGVLAVSTICAHLACPTTLCASSGWWECACHGSRYDALGFHRAGPAAHGLDYLVVSAAADGKLIVDPRTPITGVDNATAFVAADAAGPACV